jgi:hypothetical protein
MKLLVTEDGYSKQRSLVPGDYSYIDLEDILEEDDEGLGEQLNEGPGKLIIHHFLYVFCPVFHLILPTELVYFCITD